MIQRKSEPGVLRRAVQGLSPAYFAMVMATGIVSLAAHLLAMPRIAEGLFWLNMAAYAGLWLLTALRAVWYPRELARDMVDHGRGPGFFTAVAALRRLCRARRLGARLLRPAALADARPGRPAGLAGRAAILLRLGRPARVHLLDSMH